MNDVKDFGDYSVKSVKSFEGMEGYGFNANLFRGKKKVASAIDSGDGGEVNIRWLDRQDNTEENLLKEHLAKLPKVKTEWTGCGDLEIDEGWFVSECVTKWEHEKEIRKMVKQCKIKTLYRNSNHKNGQYGILSAPCDDQVRNWLKNKYGNDIEIFNDVLDEGKVPSVLSV